MNIVRFCWTYRCLILFYNHNICLDFIVIVYVSIFCHFASSVDNTSRVVFKPFTRYKRGFIRLQQTTLKNILCLNMYKKTLLPTAFWKHSDKRRNCTKRAISPLDTMFSTFCHRLSVQLWKFSIFWQNEGKGLKAVTGIT